MNMYKGIFARKVLSRFEAYIEDVAIGKARISGATLNPGQLVLQVLQVLQVLPFNARRRVPKAGTFFPSKATALQLKTIDAQWQTLVQRIKDAGKLENSLAVCDASGSMSSPTFHDQTCPMHSSIALSILLPDITAPPFGGMMIGFSKFLKVYKILAHLPFSEKVEVVRGLDFGLNTDFLAVFLQCLLPIAVENKLKKEDMIKQVFVFSDMQFDQAEEDYSRPHYSWSKKSKNLWATNYDIIKQKFEEHGYDVPRRVFWNLNGTHSTILGADPTVPKPALADTPNTAIVSGYSPGMLKTFLEGSDFDDANVEDVEDEKSLEEKAKSNALQTMMKTIGHKSYGGLVIVD
jgi:hypothetical protein